VLEQTRPHRREDVTTYDEVAAGDTARLQPAAGEQAVLVVLV